MRVMVPILQGRISSVLDTAGQFILIDAENGKEHRRQEVSIETTQIDRRAKKIIDVGTQVLICGAISRPLEIILASAGIQIIPNTCGSIQEVLDAFLSGQLTKRAFLMPGCSGKRRRVRKGQDR